jgi:cytosine/adenosine deaminase-related metal-dependent hydrolase
MPFAISPERPWTLTGRWVFPVDAAPLERGVVTVEGDSIVAVEPARHAAVDIDFGEAAIIPGLVNAHTHLDLTGLYGHAPPSPDFTGWLRQVIAFRRNRTPEQVQADIRQGIAECVHCGTTLVGDISGDGGTWEALASAPLRAVIYREFLGLPADRASRSWERLDNWLLATKPTETCRPGASPHAPYSVRADLFLAAATRGVPVATHLAETVAELELLEHHRGPFVSFLQDLGVWSPDGLARNTDHILSLLAGVEPTLIVHGNYLRPDTKLPSNASLVYCPRTHAAFGHTAHPFREFLRRGVRVALGTDSLASNPDLDLLAEARFLHEHYAEVPGEAILRMATLSGAEALGLADETGSLTPGKSADFAIVPLTDSSEADPYRRLLGGCERVSAVIFRGRQTFAIPPAA